MLRRSLQNEIKIAKDRTWSELVETVESDSWGRPYRTVTRKVLVRTEMETELLLQMIGTFFPPQEDSAAEQSRQTIWTVEWTDDWEVTEEELWEATRRMASRDVTPGLNGITGRI